MDNSRTLLLPHRHAFYLEVNGDYVNISCPDFAQGTGQELSIYVHDLPQVILALQLAWNAHNGG